MRLLRLSRVPYTSLSRWKILHFGLGPAHDSTFHLFSKTLQKPCSLHRFLSKTLCLFWWFIDSFTLSLSPIMSMSKTLKLVKDNASNPKLWLAIGIGVAGIVVLVKTQSRRRRVKTEKEDFGAFILRFELPPFPQPPPPAAKHTLSGLKFAIKDTFVSGFSFLCFFVSFFYSFGKLFLFFFWAEEEFWLHL